MADRYDQNVYTAGQGSSGPGSSSYSYTGGGGTTTGSYYQAGQTIQINLPGGGQASINPATGQGSGPFGRFTFTPGLSGSDLQQTIAAVASMSVEYGGGRRSGGTAGAGGGSAAGGVNAAGGSGSGGPFGSLLRQYGLEELVPMVDQWVRDGLTWAEIESQLLDTSTSAGQVVDRIYPELRIRRDSGLAPMSIGEIQSYRTTARQMFRAAGLPEGFWDSDDDFRNFITKDVSVQELSERVEQGYVRVAAAPPEVRSELQRLYGLGTGDLAAFFLDDKKALPLIQRRVAAAEISGAGVRTGFGSLSVEESEGLASQGVTADQAQQGLGELATARELFTPIARNEDVISRQEQLGAVFSNDSAAKQRIARRQRQRTATFEGGGALATGRTGYAGLSTQG